MHSRAQKNYPHPSHVVYWDCPRQGTLWARGPAGQRGMCRKLALGSWCPGGPGLRARTLPMTSAAELTSARSRSRRNRRPAAPVSVLQIGAPAPRAAAGRRSDGQFMAHPSGAAPRPRRRAWRAGHPRRDRPCSLRLIYSFQEGEGAVPDAE